MKAFYTYLLLFGILGSLQAQETAPSKRIYTTSSGEIIFSWADLTIDGNEEPSVMRFSPVINIQNWVNIDYSDNFGAFSGLSVRNVGFIADDPTDASIRKKFRTYNIGIPFGVKIGNLSNKFLFVGYELEIPVHYKEKTFINEDKEEKDDIWFSSRVNTINHSLMAGIQLPYGATLKFKYYLTNFFNKDYTQTENGVTFKPYENSDVNIFYFSLSFGLLKNTNFYYNKD